MAKVIGGCPFHKFNRYYEPRLEPPALVHIFGGQALTPPSHFALRQILEWTSRRCQPGEATKEHRSRRGNEAVSNPRRIKEFLPW
jgi:hypothetical protein